MRKLQVTQSNITRLQHQVNRMKDEVENAYRTCRQTNKKYDKLITKIKYQKARAKLPETKEVLDKILENV